MARLEIPSIVVHKGDSSNNSRSQQERPESPVAVVYEGMPSLSSTKQGFTVVVNSNPSSTFLNTSKSDMLDGNTNSTINNSPAQNSSQHSIAFVSSDKPDTENKSNNFRNRTNTKVKLLVRSHAMRESTSPPRESSSNHSFSPHNVHSLDSAEKLMTVTVTATTSMMTITTASASPSINVSSDGKSLRNNESTINSNLSSLNSQSFPKQMRNVASSPSPRIPQPRNSLSTSAQNHSAKNNINATNGGNNNNNNNNNSKVENQRGKSSNGSYAISKCNNCVKYNHNDKSSLLQTPISPYKCNHSTLQHQSLKNTNQSSCLSYNSSSTTSTVGNNQHKSLEHQQQQQQRRPNTLNLCHNQCNSAQCVNTLSVNSGRPGSRHRLRHQNSSQGSNCSSFDNASPSLSRDSSTELYTDSTGTDLEQFIADTINRNQKDRTVLLKIEKELIEFAKDRQKVCHRFPNMSSYNRMLVHRVAAYFGMEHNVDQSGLSVIVTRTKNMRIPDTRFKEHIRDDFILTEEQAQREQQQQPQQQHHHHQQQPRRSILKRDSSSFEDSFNFKSPDRMSGEYSRRSKSFEEREEEYEKARRRIFKDSSSGDSSELVTSWPYWSSSDSNSESSAARYRLLHPPDNIISNRQTRLLKGESCDGRDSFRTNVLRPSVSKSFSFGGYTEGMLSRGDSVTSTHSAGARLTKQDSGGSVCSRLSPSSSGYKSQSQRSDTTISPSPSPSPIPNITCSHSQISSQNLMSSMESNGQTVIWAVTSISSVPPGSIIINPQTNQPYINPDGSIYRFDPDNPPEMFVSINNDDVNTGTTSFKKQSESNSTMTSVDTTMTMSITTATTAMTTTKMSASVTTTVSTMTTTTTATAVTVTAAAIVSAKSSNVNNINGTKRGGHMKNSLCDNDETTSEVTNTATSPSLPFTSPPTQQQNQQLEQQNQQLEQQNQQLEQQNQHLEQQDNLAAHSLIKTVTVPSLHGHNQLSVQPYTNCFGTSEHAFNQGAYPASMAQQTVLMASTHTTTQGQPSVQSNGQGDVVFNHNTVYANYTLPVQQGSLSQTPDMIDLSGYFMGMNVYDQRGSGDNQCVPSHSHPQQQSHTHQHNYPHLQPPPSSNQSLQNASAIHSNYWQSAPNQITHPQQAMFFMSSPGTTSISVNQNPSERQQIHQQQRFTTNYSFNLQSVTPPIHGTSNYASSYPVPYNSVPSITPSLGTEYACQPTVHVMPAAYYSSGQPNVHPTSVMYRMPTPPHTPTTNQMANVPVMYVNSANYATPTIVSAGTFGHQVGSNGTTPALAGTYMAPTILPNFVFRQNVPLVTGVRTSTPGSSQRTSRSPTPAHELLGGFGCSANGNGDRNPQSQSRYPLPVYQGVHIVQGDMRLMHSGVPCNTSRLHYTQVPSPPIIQGCPRAYRQSSYSSNTSGAGTPIPFDGKTQKIRKQRSKVTTLPSTVRSNIYQSNSMSSLSTTATKDVREVPKTHRK